MATAAAAAPKLKAQSSQRSKPTSEQRNTRSRTTAKRKQEEFKRQTATHETNEYVRRRGGSFHGTSVDLINRRNAAAAARSRDNAQVALERQMSAGQLRMQQQRSSRFQREGLDAGFNTLSKPFSAPTSQTTKTVNQASGSVFANILRIFGVILGLALLYSLVHTSNGSTPAGVGIVKTTGKILTHVTSGVPMFLNNDNTSSTGSSSSTTTSSSTTSAPSSSNII